MEYYNPKTGFVYQGKPAEIEKQIERDMALIEKGTQVLRQLEQENNDH